MTRSGVLRIASAVAILSAVAATAQTPPQQTPPPQSPPPRGGPASSALNYVPGVGDMMNMLVQPRHARLGLALKERNWELAAYALRQLQQAFATVGTVQPKYRNLTVAEMVQSMTGDATRDLDEAIHLRDAKRAGAAFDALTDGCNSCHTALDYPFVIIRTPETSSFPNQEFKAP